MDRDRVRAPLGALSRISDTQNALRASRDSSKRLFRSFTPYYPLRCTPSGRILRPFRRMGPCTLARNYAHGLSPLRRDGLEFRHSASEEPTFMSYWKSMLPTPGYVHDCFLGAHLLRNCLCLARARLQSYRRSLSKRTI